ncbi:hypothetical protein [Ferrimonas sp.]|uniref:hypothetical protein n=1 Tax=Ferrimonas sp. TaxID=2080861 RepID=UPI003A91B313
MLVILSILAIILAYFVACKRVEKVESDPESTENTYLWCPWFGYIVRIQGALTVAFAAYELIVKGYDLVQVVTAVIGFGLVILSIPVLNKSKIGWFVATAITFNPLYWIVNTVYYFKNKDCFSKAA